MGLGTGVTGLAAGVLSAEVCAPLLLLCWLCCWPDDSKSDNTSGNHPQRPVLAHVHESGSRRRSSDLFGRRIGSSAVSLHLPSTSGFKKPLSAHRSHEEIPSRRKSNLDTGDQETRYHSAPSVIDEVIHRRDWERSSKDLYIPLNPEKTDSEGLESDSSESPDRAPYAEPESSSIEAKSDEHIGSKTCKKHHTNIKSSQGKKEKQSIDIKDADATESNFYIGDSNEEDTASKNNDRRCENVYTKAIFKAKDVKQSFNESIRSKERPKVSLAPVDETLNMPGFHTLGFNFDETIDQIENLDRSGAEHHTIESRISINRHIFPPPSVEPVGYDGGACYLAEVGHLSELRARADRAGPAPPDAKVATIGVMRARHASDGDILAPTHRPESGAFSESDLDLELEGSEERPPTYEEIHHYPAHDHKETAI